MSNKDDTSIVVKELGVISEEVTRLEELVSFYKKELTSKIKKGRIFQSLDFLSGVSTTAGAFLIYEGIRTDNSTLTNTGYVLTGVGVAGFTVLHFTWRIE